MEKPHCSPKLPFLTHFALENVLKQPNAKMMPPHTAWAGGGGHKQPEHLSGLESSTGILWTIGSFKATTKMSATSNWRFCVQILVEGGYLPGTCDEKGEKGKKTISQTMDLQRKDKKTNIC